jgi:hypothetical protein
MQHICDIAKPVSIGRIVPDKTETHVESIPANVFSRENLRPIDTGFVVRGMGHPVKCGFYSIIVSAK